MPHGRDLLLTDLSCSAWADRRLLDACSALAAQELERDLHTSHRSILDTLRHICDGEQIWLDCLAPTTDLGTWRPRQRPVPELSLHPLRQGWPELWDGYRPRIEDMSESSLGVELTIQPPGDVERSLARWQILRHVLEHSTFHRGQIVAMIRALGHQPPAINRMDYYLAGEPAMQPRSR